MQELAKLLRAYEEYLIHVKTHIIVNEPSILEHFNDLNQDLTSGKASNLKKSTQRLQKLEMILPTKKLLSDSKTLQKFRTRARKSLGKQQYSADLIRQFIRSISQNSEFYDPVQIGLRVNKENSIIFPFIEEAQYRSTYLQ